MNFFNRLINRQEKAPESTSDWNSLTQADTFDEQNHATEQTKAHLAQQERQERKVISALLYGSEVIGESDADISEQDRATVYQKLANHSIDDHRKSQLLREIKAPFHQSIEHTMDQLNSKHERRILAYFSGAGFDNWESTSIYDLQNATQTFPTPYELAASEQNFLEDIREHNSPQKYAEYQDAMESFKRKTYGKRYEYYQAIESLQRKADQQAAENTIRTQVLSTYAHDIAPPPETVYKNAELRRIDPAEQREILQDCQIDGDDFIYNGKKYQLTADALEQFGLAPKYSFQLENAKINLSNPYEVANRTAVTAYVETDKGTNACSYYRSSSQGVWRLLPDYVAKHYDSKTALDWFGKGYDEDSLNLPSETQYVLEQIIGQEQKIPMQPINAEFAFAGTAKRYDSREEYHDNMIHHTLRGRHYEEVDVSPAFSLGQVSREKAAPETLDLYGPSAPNFQITQNPYTINTELYSQIRVEHLPSQDNSLRYTFNRNARGQAWLGRIEIKEAPLSSNGLHTKWASTGDFGTPLYEYQRQSDGYGDSGDTHGRYISMWRNYLSRAPLIQKYLATRKS